MSPALAARGLRKSHAGTEVLAGVGFEVQAGVLGAYAIVGFCVAAVLTHRRLLT